MKEAGRAENPTPSTSPSLLLCVMEWAGCLLEQGAGDGEGAGRVRAVAFCKVRREVSGSAMGSLSKSGRLKFFLPQLCGLTASVGMAGKVPSNILLNRECILVPCLAPGRCFLGGSQGEVYCIIFLFA